MIEAILPGHLPLLWQGKNNLVWFCREDIRAGKTIRFVFNKKGGAHYHSGISNTSQRTVQFGYGLFYVDEKFWYYSHDVA